MFIIDGCVKSFWLPVQGFLKVWESRAMRKRVLAANSRNTVSSAVNCSSPGRCDMQYENKCAQAVLE